jgi:phospholipid-translocating ATPase
MLPLLAVLAITALKDGYEDIKRHQADRNVNNSIIHTLKGEGYENRNPMKSKSKTFVPKLPIPSFKSKKARRKQVEKETQMVEETFEREAAMEQRDMEARLHASPIEMKAGKSQVTAWEDDPEAGDNAKDLGWHRTLWEDLRVGDLVKIYDHEQFPAGKSPLPITTNFRYRHLRDIGGGRCSLH